MPSVIGTGIDANYRQQIIPFSRFGTRKVAWYKVGSADVADGGGVLDMAAFNAVIDCIQTRAEIVMVGAPYIVNDTGWNKFMVAVFEDTFNNGNEELDANSGYNNMASSLEAALQAATDNNNLYVERFYLYGAPPGGANDPDMGFSSSSTFQEYGTKAEFVDNSYTF